MNKLEDAYAAELLASLSQIDAGVTTTVDTSQVQLTPEHTDACLAGLKESGRRALFAYGAGGREAAAKQRVELALLRKQYFASDDQLLTLGTQGTVDAEQWKVSRALGAPIISHIIGKDFGDIEAWAKAGVVGQDNEFIHGPRLTEGAWKAMADTGARVSIAPAIEMQM